jgi:uncharacterized protein
VIAAPPAINLMNTELKPIALCERYSSLDILRGVSLFGVLMVNLLTCFRISIFTHILSFHTDSGFMNHGVDILSAGVLETKAMSADAIQAGKIYSSGGFHDIVIFRWRETWSLIVPLLLGWLPRTIGLMFIGMATWRAGIIKNPEQHSRLLWTTAIMGGVLGGGATALRVYSQASGHDVHFPAPNLVLDAYSFTPLAFAYGAVLILLLRSLRVQHWMAPFAAMGQMALTNYLAQSIIFGFIFYGYGLGLFGRMSSACAAVLGVAIYAIQLATSFFWLRTFRFGPFEWMWRSFSYGRWQAMTRSRSGVEPAYSTP